MVQEIEPNNDFIQAQNLGTLISPSNSRTATGSVSMTDVNDVYRFRLSANSSTNFTSNLQLNLAQINNGNNDADLELFRDANNNGLMDTGDLIINAFDQPQRGTKRLELEGMGNGTYFVRVRKDRGSDVGTGQSSYRLDITSQTAQGQESEPNTDPLQADVIKGNINGIRRFQGSVNRSSDVSDFYKFKVDNPSQLSTRVLGDADKFNFSLARDFNNNGRLDGDDFAVTRNKFIGSDFENISNENLQPGTYFLQVSADSRSSGTVNYDLEVNAIPLRRAQLGVRVERLEALSDFESDDTLEFGQADFRITTTVDGSSRSSREFTDQNNVSPNFNFAPSVSPSKRFVPFSISVKEEDNSPFSSDDTADIDPDGGVGLEFTYDTLTGRITGEGIVSQEGSLISLQGNSGKRARIKFRVNYSSVF